MGQHCREPLLGLQQLDLQRSQLPKEARLQYEGGERHSMQSGSPQEGAQVKEGMVNSSRRCSREYMIMCDDGPYEHNACHQANNPMLSDTKS